MKTISDQRFTILRSIGEECIYEDELRLLLEKKPDPICYVWFEPSPMMDIEQGIMKTIYVNKMVEAGCQVKILIADWFLQRHPKIGGDLTKIRVIAEYNIAMWRAAGMYLEKVELTWFTDLLDCHTNDYWTLAMDVSRKYTLKRMASYCEYSAPYGPQTLPAAEIFYPCMQVAAMLCPKVQVDIWLFSKDQRDITMLAKDYCEGINVGSKPTILLHKILPSLLEDPEFQNERDPGRTIFMQDEEDDLDFKMWRMFCPSRVAVCNPCLEYIKSLVFPCLGKFDVVEKEGCSNKTFASMEELVLEYESGALDPADVKLAFVKAVNKILKPVGDYFRRNTRALALITARKIQDQVTSDIWKIALQNREINNL
ncbi:unnamed protein product [Urochloa humidicola]